MKNLKKPVLKLLLLEMKELTNMSFNIQGKRTLILTMLLTGASPIWAYGQMTPVATTMPQTIEQKLPVFTQKKSWVELSEVLEKNRQSESALESQKQSSKFLDKIKKDKKIYSAGTDLSGGGTSVKVSSSNSTPSKVLLDFYNFNNVPQKSTPPLILPRTEALKKLGIEKLQLEQTSFSTELQKQFQIWKVRSPLFIKYLEQAKKNISVYYTSYQIPKLDSNTYFPDQNFHDDLQPRSVALYVKGFGVLVSLNEFEHLSFENQTGLILHEIIRHLQIGYGFKMKDETVQLLVNAILTANPTNSDSLDSEEFFGKKKWYDLKSGDNLNNILPTFSESSELIMKYSGIKINTKIKSYKNVMDIHDIASSLKLSLGEISYKILVPRLEECREEENRDCETLRSDLDKVDLLIAKNRTILLGVLVGEFNAIEDDLKDRTIMLENTRQIELEIECANNQLCNPISSKNRLGGIFVELLKSGDLSQ